MTELIDKQKLHDALRQMGKKNLKPVFREFWTPQRPSTGYCYVVAEVVYHYLVPKGSRPHVIRLGGTDTHWFVKDPAGNIIDLTADQFDEPCDYTQGRPQNFMTPGISKRGKKLADLLGLTKEI